MNETQNQQKRIFISRYLFRYHLSEAAARMEGPREQSGAHKYTDIYIISAACDCDEFK